MSPPHAYSERVVPEGCLVLVPLPVGADAILFPEEVALIGEGAGDARRASFAGGRHALRRALAFYGVAPSAILKDDRGAPRVPQGYVGSISHKSDLAVAIASPRGDECVGIDVEAVKPTKGDIAPRVLRDDELAALATLRDAERVRALLVRFALKEAVYKAIDPFLRRYVDYRACEAIPAADGTARIRLFLHDGEPELACAARYFEEGSHVIAIARARVS